MIFVVLHTLLAVVMAWIGFIDFRQGHKWSAAIHFTCVILYCVLVSIDLFR